MEWLRHVLGLAKFYSAIENIERISTRESEFYPQVLEIPDIDRASQAVRIRKQKRLVCFADGIRVEPQFYIAASSKIDNSARIFI